MSEQPTINAGFIAGLFGDWFREEPDVGYERGTELFEQWRVEQEHQAQIAGMEGLVYALEARLEFEEKMHVQSDEYMKGFRDAVIRARNHRDSLKELYNGNAS